jgi:hypothetical protein
MTNVLYGVGNRNPCSVDVNGTDWRCGGDSEVSGRKAEPRDGGVGAIT